MVKFDRHALRRMKWRKISEADVMTTLENPERTEDTIKGRKNAYRLIGDRFLKVTYGDRFQICPPRHMEFL
jgi:hypothetical protein